MSIETAIAQLGKALGDKISTSDAVRSLHGQNESYFDQTLPDAVVFPASTEDVVTVARVCHAHDCPIVPWGTGTSLEGNALPTRGGISLDFTQMNRVRAVHTDDMDIVVEPGITREEVNSHLRDTGLFFPVDPGANASIGGMAATRASGTTAVRYGTMRENVMALEVVLADGRVIRTGSRARKSAAGYDLTKLFVGSEGTLGIITEATLRLQGIPEAISAATCRFEQIDGAVNTVIQSIQMGIPVARMEFIDEVSLRGFNSYFNTDTPEAPHLFLEFHGSTAAVAEQAEMVGEIASEHGGAGFEWSAKTEDRTRLWSMRHNAFYALKAMRPGARAVTTDVCVPISRLADIIRETRKDIDASGITGPMLGHVGDGNFHTTLMVEGDLAPARALADRMAERALEMGGTVTGEHGVGLGKMRFMEAEHGDAWRVMADLKKTLDPTNILNPGKVVQVN